MWLSILLVGSLRSEGTPRTFCLTRDFSYIVHCLCSLALLHSWLHVGLCRTLNLWGDCFLDTRYAHRHFGCQGALFSPSDSTLPEYSDLKTIEIKLLTDPGVQFPTGGKWPWLVACGLSVQEGLAATEPSWLRVPGSHHLSLNTPLNTRQAATQDDCGRVM